MIFKDLNHEWKEISLERTLKNILGKIEKDNKAKIEPPKVAKTLMQTL